MKISILIMTLLMFTRCSTGDHEWRAPDEAQVTSFLKNHFVQQHLVNQTVLKGDFSIYEGHQALAGVTGSSVLGPMRKMRIEVYGVLGQTMWLAVSNGAHVWVADLQKRICQKLGLGGPPLVIADLQAEVPLELLLSMVSSYPFVSSNLSHSKWRLLSGSKPHEPVLWNSGQLYYEFSTPHDTTPRFFLFKDASGTYRQEFQEWKPPAANAPFAVQWRFQTEAEKKKLEWTWKWKSLVVKNDWIHQSAFEKPRLDYCP